MLIATLPSIHRQELLHQIVSCPEVGGVRYNTGMASPYDPEETLRIAKDEVDRCGKKLWVDLKGRQLRIVRWAVPDYGKIVLNHEVETDGEAYVIFRGGDKHTLKLAHGDTIYVDPPPRHAVGEGQSVNIIGNNVKIRGYLTEGDLAYIRAARKLGIYSFMLSFVEGWSDVAEVIAAYGDSSDAPLDLRLKIESPAGMSFVTGLTEKSLRPHGLIAARDDLYATIGDRRSMIIKCLKAIVAKDPQAIVASRLFTGIERDGNLALSDITDIELMKRIGYEHFMLSDRICSLNFPETIVAWKELN